MPELPPATPLEGVLTYLVVGGVLAIAALFKPWQVLRHPPLQNPWGAALLILPFVWWTERLLPAGMDGMALHLSGACLLVLMFGWPLAMWTLLPVAVGAQLIDNAAPPDLTVLADQILWRGMLPGTFALLMGLALRRWLPKHLFVYILGRGFVVTALAITAASYLAYLLGRKPENLALSDWMLAHWLLGWGEAVSTGMLTSIFVAFKPQWLLTYSDTRYLPDSRRRGEGP